jgi:hypothetical protein
LIIGAKEGVAPSSREERRVVKVLVLSEKEETPDAVDTVVIQSGAPWGSRVSKLGKEGLSRPPTCNLWRHHLLQQQQAAFQRKQVLAEKGL